MIRKNVILFLLLSVVEIFPQTTIGKYGGEFLAIGVGARSSGMGGAQVAVVNDVTAAYWNPAALARIDYPQFSLMHEEHFGDLVNYNYAAVALPFGKDMSLGVSFVRLSIDGIPDTRNAGIDENGDPIDYTGSLYPGWRLDYSKITQFSNTDLAFYFTFAKRQSDNFYWGANVKLIKRNLAEYDALGIGFDVGAWYAYNDNLFFGANLMDVTTTLVAWDTGKNDLISPTLKIGSGYNFEISKFTIVPTVDFDVRFENRQYASTFNIGPVSFDPKAGIEINYAGLFSIRAGYTDIQQFTVGAGIKLPKLYIDYSFARFSGDATYNLDDSHRISLILSLEEKRFER
jgi:hypothetical protein